MFNGHIAERRLAKQRQTEDIQKKEAFIRKRYHTEVQPNLLDHYSRRLKSFIHKMEEKPIIINPENLLPIAQKEPHFVFKSPKDWISLIPPRQRQQKQKNEQLMKRKSTLDEIEGIDRLSSKLYQFRIRQKVKEIHAPMRYGNILKEGTTPKNKSKRKQAAKTKKKDQIRNLSRDNSKFGILVKDSSSTSRIHDGDETEFNSKEKTEFNYQGRQENIEIEARLYEKLRQPNQKKMHFKKITDLAITSTDNCQKRQLREILRKSGFAKVKPTSRVEAQQADVFSMLIANMTQLDK